MEQGGEDNEKAMRHITKAREKIVAKLQNPMYLGFVQTGELSIDVCCCGFVREVSPRLSITDECRRWIDHYKGHVLKAQQHCALSPTASLPGALCWDSPPGVSSREAARWHRYRTVLERCVRTCLWRWVGVP